MTQSSYSEPDSPPRGADDDLFGTSQRFGKGYGSRYARSDYFNPLDEAIIEETNSQLNTPTKTPTRTPNKSINESHSPLSKSRSSLSTASPLRHKSSNLSTRQSDSPSIEANNQAPTTCAKCSGKLFTMGNGGSFITVPSDKDATLKRYHIQCFTCHICDGVFEKGSNGQATFVKYKGNACHPEACSIPIVLEFVLTFPL
jgi:hypothetical protein